MISKRKQTKAVSIFFLIFIEVMPLVIPEGLQYISNGVYQVLFRYCKWVGELLIVFHIFYILIKSKEIAKDSLYVILLAIVAAASSLVNGCGLRNWYSAFAVCILATFVVEINKSRLDKLILVLLPIMEFWIYLNFICVLLYPSGMYKSTSTGYVLNWILGYKSSFQYLIVPAIALAWLNMAYRGCWGRFIALLVISTIQALLSKNMMLVVGLAIILIFFFFNLHRNEAIFNMKNYMIVALIVNIFFIFFFTAASDTYIISKFLDLIGKEASLSTRNSVIWPITLLKIKDSLFWGNGVLSSDERRIMYLGIRGAVHAHNQLLEVFFIGGIIMLIIYMIINLRLCKKLQDTIKIPASKIFAFVIFVFYCMMTVEVFIRSISFSVWIILLLAFNCSNLDEQFRTRKDYKPLYI